jgi:hypothetical protein
MENHAHAMALHFLYYNFVRMVYLLASLKPRRVAGDLSDRQGKTRKP